jgi:hypothetical protein
MSAEADALAVIVDNLLGDAVLNIQAEGIPVERATVSLLLTTVEQIVDSYPVLEDPLAQRLRTESMAAAIDGVTAGTYDDRIAALAGPRLAE